MRVIAAAALATTVVSPALAQTGVIEGAFAGCKTEDGVKEFVRAAVDEDLKQIEALLDSGDCMSIENREFSVVDRGMARSQIRVYIGDTSLVLWTVSSALR